MAVFHVSRVRNTRKRAIVKYLRDNRSIRQYALFVVAATLLRTCRAGQRPFRSDGAFHVKYSKDDIGAAGGSWGVRGGMWRASMTMESTPWNWSHAVQLCLRAYIHQNKRACSDKWLADFQRQSCAPCQMCRISTISSVERYTTM